MLPDRVSNPGPLTYESGALPIALRGPARSLEDLEDKSIISLEPMNENSPNLHSYLIGTSLGAD